MRLAFWLHVMDLIAWLGGFGSRPYLWAVSKASDATDWGVPRQSNGDSKGDQ